MIEASSQVAGSQACVNVSSATTRFWSKVDKFGPIHPYDQTLGNCWLWKSARDKDGYGKFWFQRKEIRAHRFSGLISGLPLDRLICHSCDNTECVNPIHLFAGSNQDNLTDMVRKGRAAKGDMHRSHLYPDSCPSGARHHTHRMPETVCRGEKNGMAKLTEDGVRKIRSLSKDFSRASLSAMFNVTEQTIRAVVILKSWKHVK